MLIVEERAFHCFRDKHDKCWAACRTSTGIYIVLWGRRGTRYNTKTKNFSSLALAEREFERLVREKLGKGYLEVAFGDPQHGNIPSFGNSIATSQGEAEPNSKLITPDSLVADISAFNAGVAGNLTLENDQLRMRFAQLQVKSLLLLDLTSDTASQTRLKASTHQMQTLFLELDRHQPQSCPVTQPSSASNRENKGWLEL